MSARDLPAGVVEERPGARALRIFREAMQGWNNPRDPGAIWRDVSWQTKTTLVAFCTDRREVELSASQGWAAFTEVERVRMACTLRQWGHDARNAGFLR